MVDDSQAPTPPKSGVRTRDTHRRFIEEAVGEEYLHKVVWLVALRQLNHANEQPRGATLDYLAAIVFTSHDLEGYLNFLGGKIAPDRWAGEQIEFGRSGVKGKFRALEQLCGLEPLQPDRRPFSTIAELKHVRNRIAHPRTLVDPPTSTEYPEGKEPPLFRQSWIGKVATKERAERAIGDVEELARRLHAAAYPRFPVLHLVGPDPLGGILAARSTTSHALKSRNPRQ